MTFCVHFRIELLYLQTVVSTFTFELNMPANFSCAVKFLYGASVHLNLTGKKITLIVAVAMF